MSPQNNKHPFPFGTLLLAALFALAMLVTWLLVKPSSPPAELQGVLRSDYRPLAQFHLQSRSHGPIQREDLLGKWTFVFFGYLSCPDVCPNTLHELGAFRSLLDDAGGAAADAAQVLFVSVDPERDSEEALASYVAHFDRRFIGATAGKAAIERFARQFGAGYVFEEETAPGQYGVAHTSAVFLVDPHARIVATFSQPHYASTLLSQYLKITEYYAGNA